MLRIALLATLLTLAAPVAGWAATYSVTAGQGGPCGGADLQCGSLAEAASAAMQGDVFEVAPGTYASATFSTGGITIKGTAAGVIVNGSLAFTAASGAVPKLQRVVIRRTADAGPALIVSGATGLELSDSIVISTTGHGALFTAGASKIERSTLLTGQPGSNAVAVESTAGTPNKALTIDSSIVGGGAAGLGARSFAAALDAAPGNIILTARHLTAAGSTDGIALDASQAARLVDPGVGNIVANVSDSIVLNGTTALHFDGVIGGDNTATINFARTRLSGDPNVLFTKPGNFNFHLKAGSPAIDQGGFSPGESTTDVDGDSRPGPVTDQGADEFVNRPPVAKVSASPLRARQNQAVTFSGAGSSDPDGPLKEYRWNFSDGTSRTTTGPTVTKAFSKPGIAGALLRVVDISGAQSTPVAAAVSVIDGEPPAVTITKPKQGSTLRLRVRGTRTRTVISFAGLASDTSGVNRVLLALRQVTKSKRSCRWLNPRRGFVVRRCNRPFRFRANQGLGRWLYIVPGKRRLRAGRYELTAIGVDNNGNSGNSAPSRRVRFRLR